MSEKQSTPWRVGDKVAVSGPHDVPGFDKPVYAVIRTEAAPTSAPCDQTDISLGKCSGELGHTGDHYLTTIYGRANWENEPEAQRACVICGEPEGSYYAKWCCSDSDNIEEV